MGRVRWLIFSTANNRTRGRQRDRGERTRENEREVKRRLNLLRQSSHFDIGALKFSYYKRALSISLMLF